MNANERRAQIEQILREANTPLSASALATQFGVSRQIVVGDVALLRAGGLNVLATPRGYVMEAQPLHTFEKQIACMHRDDRLAEEIYTIVDLGGAMLDVTVSHNVYGEITAPLHIFSRYDADLFLDKIKSSHAKPLCDLTDGVHLHRIRCLNEQIFLRITHVLAEKKLLLPH